jgi:thioesterase domain-containing protein
MGLDVEVKEENAWTETIRRLTKNHRRIVDLYRIGKYEGDLILFRVQHRSFFVEEPKYYGWQPFVRKVHLVQVSGHHDSLFIAPEIIQEVALKIQKVLDQSLD